MGYAIGFVAGGIVGVLIMRQIDRRWFEAMWETIKRLTKQVRELRMAERLSGGGDE